MSTAREGGRQSARQKARQNARRSVLLVDVGNSRLKWACCVGDYETDMRFARRGVLAWEDAGHWLRSLPARDAIDRIYVSNVAGPGTAAALSAAAREAQLPRPRFVRSAQRYGAVRNAYAQPWRLGVDRWLALIGARAEYPRRAVCVVSIGTATTIDLLDASGRHHGGVIVPAPGLMIDSLLQRTAGIRRRAAGAARRGTSLFARDTRAALTAGARHATAALIEQALVQARARLRSQPLLVLGGGGADEVAGLLPRRFERRDDLVLRGLAVMATDDVRRQIA